MKKSNKYEYWNVIQQNYGQGWEDVSHYESNSLKEDKSPVEKFEMITNKYGKQIMKKRTLLNCDLKEYLFTGYTTRVIFRKELKELEPIPS